ncbi:MAG: hypothetical protein GY822_14245 [Deltaproteobacteria bacterium]|nr:hypothetical protein [Deltaproteobacteria bacterium]
MPVHVRTSQSARLSYSVACGPVASGSFLGGTLRSFGLKLSSMTRSFLALCVFMSIGMLSGCNGEVAIVHSLTELEANEIIVILAGEDIESNKIAEEGRVITWAVVVKGSTKADALSLLVANKMPKRRVMGLAEVYPPGSGGLIPTRSEEKAKFLMALQGEIERKLTSFPGILKVHVSVVIPEKEVVRDINVKAPEPSASVAVVFNLNKAGEAPLSRDQVANLTAASIEGLRSERVTVLLKKNEPMVIVSQSAAQKGPRPKSVMGIKVVDKKAANKAKIILLVSIALAGLGLLLGIGGIVRSLTLRSKLSKAEAKVNSLEKARREMA